MSPLSFKLKSSVALSGAVAAVGHFSTKFQNWISIWPFDLNQESHVMSSASERQLTVLQHPLNQMTIKQEQFDGIDLKAF